MTDKSLDDNDEKNEEEEEEDEIIFNNDDDDSDDSVIKNIKTNEWTKEKEEKEEIEENNIKKNDINQINKNENIKKEDIQIQNNFEKKEENTLNNNMETKKLNDNKLEIKKEEKKENNEIKHNSFHKREKKPIDTNKNQNKSDNKIENSNNKKEYKKENENENNNNNNNLNLDTLSKDDLLALLMNNPINAEEEEEEKDEKIKLNLHFNSKIKDEQEKEDDDTNFNKALNKVLTKLSKNKKSNNNELYDLLLNDKDLIENELKKYNLPKKINISKKIQSYIEKKNKNLKEIKEKKEEEFKQKYTFAPIINKKNNSDNKKRNLNQFLKDQEEYQQKINEKITNIKDSQIKKEEEQLKLKPKIQISSEKMAQEKYKGEEVFKRLYNQQQKKNIEKEVKKAEKNFRNNNINNNVNEEYLNNLYQDAKNREKKNKEKEDLENKKRKEQINYKAALNSNKYLFNKFKNNFKNQIEKLISNSEIENNKIDLNQLKELFINLNFIPQSQSNSELMNNLLNEIFENLKDENDLICIDHIFIFCISILGLFDFYILSNYQINNSNNTIQTDENENNENENKELINSSSQKNLKSNISSNKPLQKNFSVKTVGLNDDISSKLEIINKDFSSRIINNVKFGGFDNENNFIITSNYAKLISKHFITFYQNYNNPNFYDNIKDNNIKSNNNRKFSKKNLIPNKTNNTNNNNKEKNSDKNYNKIIPNTSENKKQNRSNSNSRRIEQLYLESAKKKNHLEKEKEKFLEQKEKEEKKICTFKPKINSNSKYNNNIIPVAENMNSQEFRMELLYKKGTEILLNKKDKTNDEIEAEKYKDELTFKPNIHDVNYDIFKKNLNVNDSDFEKFNQRLQKGREERELKEAAFERGEFLIQNPRNLSENKKNNNNNDNNNNIKNTQKKKSFGFKKKRSFVDKKDKDDKINFINDDYNKNYNTYNIRSKHENENPILQIDINLKHGLKKQVLVYEGDTAENLAKEFSEENNLDDKMKKKLEILIQQEIDKLLSKIDEESRSTLQSNNKYV